MASNNSHDPINNPKHYKGEVEPIELIQAQELGYCEGNIVKYVVRWKEKGGVEDLEKCHWYIHQLIEYEKEKQEKKQSQLNLQLYQADEDDVNSDPEQESYTYGGTD